MTNKTRRCTYYVYGGREPRLCGEPALHQLVCGDCGGTFGDVCERHAYKLEQNMESEYKETDTEN